MGKAMRDDDLSRKSAPQNPVVYRVMGNVGQQIRSNQPSGANLLLKIRYLEVSMI